MKRLEKLSCLLALGIILVSSLAMADNAGQFTEIEGSVTVKKANGQSVQVVLGTAVGQGDLVTTARSAKATILFKDGSVLRLGSSTSLRINKLVYEEDKGIVDAAYDLARGSLMSVVGSLFGNDGSNYQVTTPTSVSGVRGCIYLLKVGKETNSGQVATMAVGIFGLVNFTGGQGDTQQLNPRMYSVSRGDETATAPVEISDATLQAMIEEVTVTKRSLNLRASGLRRDLELKVPRSISEPDILTQLLGGDIVLDPDNIVIGDNPADLIYQEPPQFTELIIIVNVP